MSDAERREGIPLQVRNVSVHHGALLAVDEASLEAPRRTITALVGPSGCGKTTLLRCIAGFEVPSGGTVAISGRPVVARDCWVAPERRSVGMVFQQGALFPHLTVRQNVAYGLSGHREAEPRARKTLDLVGLSRHCERFPDELSGGEQQRVALARALAPEPEIVLLDEPFANLDATTRKQVRDDVCAVLRAAGATAVIVTHDQEEALSVADRVAVMMRGRILQVGTPEQVYCESRTSALAQFIGEGQLLPCAIRAGRLRSALGPAECHAPDGKALLLVRPEDLVLSDSGTGGVGGQIRERRFFGHDLVHAVALESGEILQVRGPCNRSFATNTAVRVRLSRKSYRIYPIDDDAEFLGQATPVESPS